MKKIILHYIMMITTLNKMEQRTEGKEYCYDLLHSDFCGNDII